MYFLIVSLFSMQNKSVQKGKMFQEGAKIGNELVETAAGYDGNTIVESRSIETDDSTCNDPILKAIIEV